VRVLQANKYLFRRDGVTAVVEGTIRLLRERGHDIVAFGQADPRNFTAGLPGAYVRPLSLDQAIGILDGVALQHNVATRAMTSYIG
jgi:hypothetical protein